MAKNDILIRYAFLTTSERLPDRFLFSGKLLDEKIPEISLFYLFEICSPWAASIKVKKSICDTLEKNFSLNNDSEEQFENILQKINESLNSLAKKGESSWIGNLNGIIGILAGNEIYLAQTGKISGYIFRKGKISSLTENLPLKEELHPLKTFSDITSGRLIPDDRIAFGNMELYNHLSLDRIRRTMEGLSAKEALQELFRNLKRSRVSNVSAILIETKSDEEAEKNPEADLPEVLSLTEAEENVASVLKKRYSPIVKASFEKSRDTSIKTFHFLLKHGKIVFHKTSKNIKEKYGPQAKKFLGKSSQIAGNTLHQAKNSIEPQLNKIKNGESYQKIKVKTFTRKGNSTGFVSIILKVCTIIGSTVRFLLIKENRKYLYGILIILLVFMGYLKIRANNASVAEEKEKQQISLSYDKAKEVYDKAKEDIALGRTSDTSKLNDALALAKKAEESNTTKDKAAELAKEIQQSLDKMTKTKRLYNPEANITFNNSTKKIVLVGSDIYGFDGEGKVYSANTQDKDARLIASIGKENNDISSLSFSSNSNKIFIYTKDNKLISFDTNSKTQGEAKISEGQWEKASAIANFAANLYLLDSVSGQIWKHTDGTGGFSKGITYINGKSTNVKDAIDMAVDGNIYVLLNDGKVSKFGRGNYDQSFSLKDIPSPNSTIENPKKIYTDEDVNYIFVLDQKLNRILRFDKSGEFVAQYALDDMPIDDFTVNGKIQKLWMLSGGKIYTIDF
ncbi:MAG: hypothetical protein M1324_03400 [Patescibacteria group bacterium]|nr:hypothetical protein [Patescibacteria group bacterium]